MGSLVRRVRGKLVIIGGAEEKEGECVILREFVRLAGGAKARIVIMTVATNFVAEVGGLYSRVFRNLGVRHVSVADIRRREDAYSAQALNAVRQATGVFFTGGNQIHITSLLGGAEIETLLHQSYRAGAVLAGTSAGAAMMSNSMIIDGVSRTNPRYRTVAMGPGMEFLLGTVIDTHFSQRGRIGRLLTATAHYPHDIGIGIDEDTAIVVDNERFVVIGSGAVTILDLGSVKHTNLPELEKRDSLALFSGLIHILPAGYEFDLQRRQPIYKNGQTSASKILTPRGKARSRPA